MKKYFLTTTISHPETRFIRCWDTETKREYPTHMYQDDGGHGHYIYLYDLEKGIPKLFGIKAKDFKTVLNKYNSKYIETTILTKEDMFLLML